MVPAMLDSVKRPLLGGGVSAFCMVAVTLLWLRFPSAIPIAVFMIVGFVAAVAFLVCGTIVVLRVARMFAPGGPLAREIGDLPRGALVGLGATLLVCNGVLIYFTDLRPIWLWVLALSAGIVVSWGVARLVAARRTRRG
jgi:hypothetical protein